LSAFEAVAIDTPARFATWARVTAPLLWPATETLSTGFLSSAREIVPPDPLALYLAAERTGDTVPPSS
jgi:hypothetical protein